MAICDNFPHVIVLKLVLCSRAPCQVNESLTNIAASQLMVSTVELGVRFLKQRNPELLADALSEDRLTLGIAWNQLIYCNILPTTILAQPDPVEALLIVFRLCCKQALDLSWFSRKDRHGGEEPVVA